MVKVSLRLFTNVLKLILPTIVYLWCTVRIQLLTTWLPCVRGLDVIHSTLRVLGHIVYYRCWHPYLATLKAEIKLANMLRASHWLQHCTPLAWWASAGVLWQYLLIPPITTVNNHIGGLFTLVQTRPIVHLQRSLSLTHLFYGCCSFFTNHLMAVFDYVCKSWGCPLVMGIYLFALSQRLGSTRVFDGLPKSPACWLALSHKDTTKMNATFKHQTAVNIGNQTSQVC